MQRGAAVVTGGAGGIGQAVLARLAADGFTPVSWDLSTEVPVARLALAVDVTDADALQAAAARTQAEAGPIRAVVINAGILGPVARVWDVPAAELRRVIETNLVSAFLTVQATVPHLLANAPGPDPTRPDRGRVVLMASVQAKEGTALSGPYAAAKAGMIALTKVLGKELAEAGVLVNAVTPTVVRTAMEREISPARRADLLGRIPMGRFLDVVEVAEMVAFLCGPGCSFSTGAVFDLSGGRATY